MSYVRDRVKNPLKYIILLSQIFKSFSRQVHLTHTELVHNALFQSQIICIDQG